MTEKIYYEHINEYGDESFIHDSHLFGERQAWIYIHGPIPEGEVIRIRDSLNEFIADKNARPLERAGVV